MKKFTRILLWLLAPAVLLLSTSCFDITEEYHIKNDGSGNATITIDVSSLMSMMESFGGEEGGSTDEISKMFEDQSEMERLREIPGITNVQNISNRETGIVGYTYDFSNLDALNLSLEGGGDLTSLASSMGIEDEGAQAGPNKMLMKGKKFTRIHPTDVKQPKGEVSEEDESTAALASAMLAEGEYKIIYHFDSKVKKSTIPGSEIGADGKTVIVKTNLGELSKGDVKMGGSIKLK